MTIRGLLLSIIIVVLLASKANAQDTHQNRLEVQQGEVYQVGPGNVLILDTLILHKGASIQFSPRQKGVLQVKAAFVGDNCNISSVGVNGSHGSLGVAGTNGTDGGNLDISIHFVKLGSLIIDTRGGNGGNGYVGKNGKKPRSQKTASTVLDASGNPQTVYRTTLVSTGTKGEAGTPGGVGGNGGDLTLSYSSDDFVINFNHQARYAQKASRLIEVKLNAGTTGKPGKDGNSFVGVTEAGTAAIPGAPVSVSHQPRRDGQLKLIKADSGH